MISLLGRPYVSSLKPRSHHLITVIASEKNSLHPPSVFVQPYLAQKLRRRRSCRRNYRAGRLKMEAYRGQGGIQQLLTAEQDAQQIVSAARTAKIARLKQAKDESEKESAEYRTNLDLQFQNNLSETSGNSGANVKRFGQETEEKIQQLKDEAGRISSNVADMLLRQVTIVKN